MNEQKNTEIFSKVLVILFFFFNLHEPSVQSCDDLQGSHTCCLRRLCRHMENDKQGYCALHHKVHCILYTFATTSAIGIPLNPN